jgi:hypothetical protein
MFLVFVLAEPFRKSETRGLRIGLDFQNPRFSRRTLGRFRLATTSDPCVAEMAKWRVILSHPTLSGWTKLAGAYVASGNMQTAGSVLQKAMQEPEGGNTHDQLVWELLRATLSKNENAHILLDRVWSQTQAHPR